MTDDKKRQYTLKISQASRTQLVVILYEMTLDYLKEAEDAAGSRDEAAFHTGIKRARACIHELSHSLNHEYPVSGNLLQLYLFADRMLIQADARKDAALLKEPEDMVRKLKDAYETISEQDDSGAVMENTQTVYAGLTYGRGALNESLADQGSSRGFRV